MELSHLLALKYCYCFVEDVCVASRLHIFSLSLVYRIFIDCNLPFVVFMFPFESLYSNSHQGNFQVNGTLTQAPGTYYPVISQKAVSVLTH